MEDSSIKNELLCKVCGDKASGKHYGVSSCDGCRGFFKRSIRRNLEYVCKENGRCVVDVTRRNQCQACRFRKCLQVNMKRDAVQHERAPRSTMQATMHHYPLSFGPRLRTLHTMSSSFFPGLPLQLQSHSPIDPLSLASPAGGIPTYLHQSFVYPGIVGAAAAFGKHGGGGLFGGAAGGNRSGDGSPGLQSQQNYSNKSSPNFCSRPQQTTQQQQQSTVKEDEVSSSEEATGSRNEESNESTHKLTKNLELPLINEMVRRPAMEIPSLTLFPSENIYESAAKLLFLAIKWARSIPSFLQLSYRDQTILLEESWNELFILTAAQWGLTIDENLLSSNAISSNQRQLEEDARKLRDVINRLILLRVDHTEHACLKALVLFKPESKNLCEVNHVELLQDQTHVMLSEYCNQRQLNQKGRFGKLLLVLPAVQALNRRSLEELLFRQTVGDVTIDRLLNDLAKATMHHA